MQARQSCRSIARKGVVARALCVFLLLLAVSALLSGQDSTHRKIVTRVNPEYPDALRMAQIGGLVRLGVTVSPNGNVTQVEVRGGNPILAEKAQQAVMKWKFAPASAQTVEEVRISFSPH
jgi:TonB family protein